MDIDELTQAFIDAYDEWCNEEVTVPEFAGFVSPVGGCSGEKFDNMVRAREKLAEAQKQYAEDRK